MPKVLVVDDSRFQVDSLKQALEEKRFEVVTAQDAMQAAIALRRATPDAVVLDINMPGGSGLEVLKRLQNSGQPRRVPVIVVSGNQNEKTKEEALKLGAVEFLQKPVDPDKLAQLLMETLSVRR